MQLWKIVGGERQGGILVREGLSLKSPQLSDRLVTGAIVAERCFQGERLNYELQCGTGPKQGWISVKFKDNELAIKITEKDAGVMTDSPEASLGNVPHMSIAERCEREIARPVISWRPVDFDWVTENHNKREKGMFYGLEFPWNEKMLLEFGPTWLTKAFQAAGTLDSSNSVTEIVNVKKHEAGNNGGKTLFEVRYQKPSTDLHVKLFAKYPFDMNDSKQASDSLAQRLYKQPQDFTEINFSRLMETFIPFKTPKFYYGDISNLSTNFILITEQVQFDDPGNEIPLAPFQIEGPYDKAMDWTLRGSAIDYYYVLVRKGAIMAALHKSGKLAPQSVLDQFDDSAKKVDDSLGKTVGITGDPNFKSKLAIGESFMFEVASDIFPSSAKTPGFRERWLHAMRTANAYAAESFHYRHSAFPEYVAFTHQNINVDNAFFWRDEQGQLDAGLFDWGNQKACGLGHMFYWWVYVAEWSMLCDHLHGLMDFLIDTLQEHGGPKLDKDHFYKMYRLAALEHNGQIIPAVPLIYKMCSKKQFQTITSRMDDRIFKTVDGKSTCRVYLHCWCNAVNMINEWDMDGMLEMWTREISEPPFSVRKKDIGSLYK